MSRYAVLIQSFHSKGATEKVHEDLEDESKAKTLCRELVAKGKEDNAVGILSIFQGPEGDPWQWREIYRCANEGGKVVDQPLGYPYTR